MRLINMPYSKANCSLTGLPRFSFSLVISNYYNQYAIACKTDLSVQLSIITFPSTPFNSFSTLLQHLQICIDVSLRLGLPRKRTRKVRHRAGHSSLFHERRILLRASSLQLHPSDRTLRNRTLAPKHRPRSPPHNHKTHSLPRPRHSTQRLATKVSRRPTPKKQTFNHGRHPRHTRASPRATRRGSSHRERRGA